MANTLLVGAQWGEEGKGKIIDVLTAKTDIVVRSQGGNDAGHTVMVHALGPCFAVSSLSRSTVSLQAWRYSVCSPVA